MLAYKIKILDNDVTVLSPVTDDIICSICEGVLENATYGPCGCQYCEECIKNTLSDGVSTCPGPTDECSVYTLNFSENIFEDVRGRKKVSRLRMKCPFESCDVETTYSNMAEHMKNCDKQVSLNQCPFVSIGCNTFSLSTDTLRNHMTEENISHSVIIARSLLNCETNIIHLQEQNSDSENLVKFCVNKHVSEIQERVEGICKNMMLSYQRELDELKLEIGLLTTRISEIGRNIEGTNQSTSDYQSNERSGSTTSERKCQELKRDFDSKINNIALRIDKTERDLNSSQRESQLLREQLQKLQKNQELNNFVEFVWKIENITQKKLDAEFGPVQTIHSDGFYRQGYKLCLRLDPDGNHSGKGSHISVYFIIMKGHYDDVLPWPMKKKIIISIANQITGDSYKEKEYSFESTPEIWRYCYNKPRSETNVGWGDDRLISWSELVAFPGLINNDVLYIKCRVCR